MIESGILELYAMGLASEEETEMVERMASEQETVKSALDEVISSLEEYATAHAVQPPLVAKPFIMASLNFIGRLENGEQPSAPPLLGPTSAIDDYREWLDRPDLQLAERPEDAYAYIIGHTPEAITAIVWLSKGAFPEVHHDEYEKFLVVEGSCCITIEGTPHYLNAGDQLSIPLHADHFVQVTSEECCKVILQRIAA